MPRINYYCQLLAATILFQSCVQDEPLDPSTQTVQFTFALDSSSPAELPVGSSVVLSISTPSGQPTLTDHEVGIHPGDNGFTTEPISLPANDYYVITEFMVVHDDAALYAIPKAGSEFSGRVTKPLSYAVSLRDKAVLPLQVVATRDAAAEQFGYETLRVKNATDWKIMVFTRDNGTLKKSAAWHYVAAPGIAYGGQLEAGMNTLTFEGDPQQAYTLIVEKAGYETYRTEFVYDDILGGGNKPFKVILDRVLNENAFTITPPRGEGEFSFRLGLRGTGSLTLDWGDGTVETISFAPDPTAPGDASFVVPTHDYAAPLPLDEYHISVTGALDQITIFESISVYATDIDSRNLTGLQRFSLEGAPINGLLDLSSNSELQFIRFLGTYAWEIRLPDSHNVSELFLNTEIAQAVVDMLIENIHDNAVAKNILSGIITIVPPLVLSAESAQRVQNLVDNYGWELRETE